MHGGAWEATVHRVAKSRTWLSDFTFSLLLTFNIAVFILIFFEIKIHLHCALCFHHTQGSAEDLRVLPFPLLTLFAPSALTCTDLYQSTQPTISQLPCFTVLRTVASVVDLLGPAQRSVSSVSSQMLQSQWLRHQIGVQSHLRSSSPNQAHREIRFHLGQNYCSIFAYLSCFKGVDKVDHGLSPPCLLFL